MTCCVLLIVSVIEKVDPPFLLFCLWDLLEPDWPWVWLPIFWSIVESCTWNNVFWILLSCWLLIWVLPIWCVSIFSFSENPWESIGLLLVLSAVAILLFLNFLFNLIKFHNLIKIWEINFVFVLGIGDWGLYSKYIKT